MKTDQEFKADGGKADPTLLEQGCTRALRAVQATLDYGKIKYEPHSWMKVPDAGHRYDAAARRHRIARDMGKNFDPESGLLHLAHEVICNLFVLELFLRAHPGIDYTHFKTPPQEHKTRESAYDDPERG